MLDYEITPVQLRQMAKDYDLRPNKLYYAYPFNGSFVPIVINFDKNTLQVKITASSGTWYETWNLTHTFTGIHQHLYTEFPDDCHTAETESTPERPT